MKKQLVASLAAAMVLGVAGTSFAAANPFSDVPAKHWSYDSVTKLSQAGIVDGYGDGTFKGDKMMTRYEMAQIVGKAMAKSDKADAAQKAQIDKLAAEFAEELNVLGVRVSSLEKRVGTIKLTGDARIRVVSNRIQAGNPTVANTNPVNDTKTMERFRINLTSDVNENTSVYARILIGHTEMGTGGANQAIGISDAAFTTKNVFNTSASLTAGRFSQSLLSTGYLLSTTGNVDGAKIAFGNKLKITTGFANFSSATAASIEDAYFANATYATSKVTTLHAAVLTERTGAVASNYALRGLGVSTKIAKDWAFSADYAQNNSSVAKTTNVEGKAPVFYVAKVNYKGADAKVQGSWGAGLEYFRADLGVLPSVTDVSTAAMIGLFGTGNSKGMALSGSYTLAKNVVLEGFQTFQAKTSTPGVDNVNIPGYSRIQVNYMF